MDEVKLSNNKDVQKAISSGRVFYTNVTRIEPEKNGQSVSVPLKVPLSVQGSRFVKGVIYEDELDADNNSNYTHLVGLRIPFVIKEVDDEQGLLVCSRKVAQQRMKEVMMPSLLNGEVFEGTITGFAHFGAFIDVNGLVGWLRNADYSTDHSRINERYKVGDHISVRCKSVSKTEQQYIAWEAATKYHRTTPFTCDLEPGALILGHIINIKSFTESLGVFVRPDDNKELDILCSMPPELEIERGVGVVVRVRSVEPGETEFSRPRLRGTILRLA